MHTQIPTFLFGKKLVKKLFSDINKKRIRCSTANSINMHLTFKAIHSPPHWISINWIQTKSETKVYMYKYIFCAFTFIGEIRRFICHTFNGVNFILLFYFCVGPTSRNYIISMVIFNVNDQWLQNLVWWIDEQLCWCYIPSFPVYIRYA